MKKKKPSVLLSIAECEDAKKPRRTVPWKTLLSTMCSWKRVTAQSAENREVQVERMLQPFDSRSALATQNLDGRKKIEQNFECTRKRKK
jgi:hypothetical protein